MSWKEYLWFYEDPFQKSKYLKTLRIQKYLIECFNIFKTIFLANYFEESLSFLIQELVFQLGDL